LLRAGLKVPGAHFPIPVAAVSAFRQQEKFMIDSTRAHAKLVAAFDQSDWPRVQHRAAQLLPLAPDDAGVYFMAGVACLQTGQVPAALDALLKATQLEPRRADYLAHYAKALALVRRLREARFAADRSMALSSDDPLTLEMLGSVYMQANAIVQSASAFRGAVALRPEHAPLRFNLAYALIALGDTAGAEHELEACIRLEPRQWPAHLSLAKLQRQTATSQHFERLRSLLERHGNDTVARIFLNMALAKEHEDLADYPTAFEHYARGKSAARSLRPPSADRDKAMFEALMRAFPVAPFAAEEGGVADAPIFIIGMPRTGTTLLDRMISSHPDVYSAGELQNFATLLQQASNSRAPLLSVADIAAHTSHIDWPRLGTAYVDSTRPATADKPRFIDKMPHNFLYAGFIARALPNARIICLRRDPLDTCLGNFRHLFDPESGFYDYSLDLLDIGRYYIQFDRLMAHWREVLPGRILEIPYESLVESPEASTRQLLAFCGLPWNDACLRSESNTAPVNTPSAWQVRAPIYKTAVGQWRRYAPQLLDLREVLAGAGIPLQD
jgi:tetratricopeptide (TPR) repeat protein